MIIDFTGISTLTETVSDNFDEPVLDENEFDWDAYNEWKDFVSERASKSCSKVMATLIIKEALQDAHMRIILKRACCGAIRFDVMKIIRGLDESCVDIDVAAARIMNLELQQQEEKRKAKNDRT